MKKTYNKVEIEVISLMAQDIITASVQTYNFDPGKWFDSDNNDKWEWDQY
ncbi:MAG: hypothetical protein IKC31_02955 [Clostridia bacterium]|nr:hypothetical protein [Clostridia bacterium]